MPGHQIPGPIGVAHDAGPIDAGTAPLIDMPLPASVGLHSTVAAASATAVADGGAAAAAPAPVLDAEIEALDLAATARTAAYALKKDYPSIRFTSGRRNKGDQARAMAGNVVSNRKWIEQTYKASDLRTKLQDWVDKNTDKTTKDDIAAGLLSVFDGATDEALGRFSKHLSGEAFDVQPVDTDADAIKTSIRALPGLDWFTDTEGGLVRWHAQF